MLIVPRVEMRRRVVVEVHRDDVTTIPKNSLMRGTPRGSPTVAAAVKIPLGRVKARRVNSTWPICATPPATRFAPCIAWPDLNRTAAAGAGDRPAAG